MSETSSISKCTEISSKVPGTALNLGPETKPEARKDFYIWKILLFRPLNFMLLTLEHDNCIEQWS